MKSSEEDSKFPLPQALSQILLQSNTHSSSPSPLNRSSSPYVLRPCSLSFNSPSNHSNLLRTTSAHLHAAIPLKQINETGNSEEKIIKQTTMLGCNEAEAVNNPSLGPQSCTDDKSYSKSKGSRHTKFGIQEPPQSVNPASGNRYDSSLGLLTKKFLSLIQEAKDGTLDLNHAANVLEVQKRRIYDITNVLEGIGLIEKTAKNHIHWKGYEMLAPKEVDDQAMRLKVEVESLSAEECRLDDCIREKQELLRDLQWNENFKKYLFLAEEDILSLPCFKNKTLIVIKAPHASSLEVPDPDEYIGLQERQHRLIIRSVTGPIDLYLLSKSKDSMDSYTWTDGQVKAELSLDHDNNQKMSSDTFGSIGSKVFGIQKIIPSEFDVDADYWLQSDVEVSCTDLWANEILSEANDSKSSKNK